LKRTLIGPSKDAVCEHCIVRCESWYEDDEYGRCRLVICPVCGNGDPLLSITEDCDNPEIDESTRAMLLLMRVSI
jgi:hypothetical protein